MSCRFAKTSRHGAAMVEFGLAFTFFFVITIGLMEFGRGAWAYSTIAHATRQGARFAIARGSMNPATEAQIAAVVQRHCMGLDTSQVTVTTTWEPSLQRGAIVQVRVRYPFQFVVSSLLFRQGGTKVTLGNTSRMVIAN